MPVSVASGTPYITCHVDVRFTANGQLFQCARVYLFRNWSLNVLRRQIHVNAFSFELAAGFTADISGVTMFLMPVTCNQNGCSNPNYEL